MRILGCSWLRLSLVSLIVLIFSAIAFANDYYVSASGSDSSDGSVSRPWKTIQHAVGTFNPDSKNTVIHVSAGTYSPNLDVNRGGSSTNVRLVLQCDPGASSANVAVGKCKITGPGYGIYVTGNNVDIVGFDIGGNPNMYPGAQSVYGGSSIASTTGNSFHLIGNYIHDLGSAVVGNGITGCPDGGAVQLNNQHGHTMTDQQAIGNIVVRFGIYPAPAGCNTAQGIYPNTFAVVQNNVVGMIGVGGITTSAPCNSVISNNVIFSTKDAIILSDIDTSTCPGGNHGHVTVSNNYIANSTRHIFYTGSTSKCTSSTPNLFSNNMSDGLDTEFSPGPFSCDNVTPSTWIHQAPSSFFVNYQADGSGDYHLKANSFGIEAGTSACVTGGINPCVASTDLEGNVRSNPPSLGAYDFVQNSSLPTAPTGLTATVQ